MSIMGSPRRRWPLALTVLLGTALALLLLRFHHPGSTPSPAVDAPPLGSSDSGHAAACAGPAPPPQNAAFERDVVALVNAERRKAALPPLDLAASLGDSARWFARDMAVGGYFPPDHGTYDNEGGHLRRVCDWSTRISWFYGSWTALAENIAAGPQTPAQVVAGWMGSPPHRAKILGRDVSETGVGYWRGGPQGSYWVQDFGRRDGGPGSAGTEGQ